ncbi:MAG: TIGR01777 family oxidoreductase [Breznakibacter sp.]
MSKKIAITGSSGFIGKEIAQRMNARGYETISVKREHFYEGPQMVAELIDGADLVVNLAGAPVLRKWTEVYKQEIYYSRVLNTRILAEAFHMAVNKPPLLISASAVGIYNNTDVHDEYSEKLNGGFLASVCADWEKETSSLKGLDSVRVAILRLGVVLGRSGGAFPLLRMQFNLLGGGKVGNGRQWFPFVHIDDLLGAIDFIIATPSAKGVYNIVTPVATTHTGFAKALGNAMHRPCWLTMPKWVLKTVYGEAASTLTEGQCVKPHRLVSEGYRFHFPTVEEATADLGKRR